LIAAGFIEKAGHGKTGKENQLPAAALREGKPSPNAGSVPIPLKVPHTLLNLASSLGLPKDRLSASILSFLRFFSLPLDASLAARIRSRAVSAGDALRQALSLAAAASLDKGTELTDAALEKYARAMDPERQKPEGGSSDSSASPDSSEADESGGEGGGSRSAGNPDRGNPDSPGNRNASGGDGALKNKTAALNSISIEALQKKTPDDPLLNILNKLPGRNGKRWLVIPFAWEQYSVTMRILIDTAGRSERLSLDIARGGTDAPADTSRWLFIMDRAESGDTQLSFGRWSGSTGKEGPARKFGNGMKKELAALLGLGIDQIYAQNSGKFPPFAPDSRDEALLSINEEV
jgi:hypothetical protein